jgi:DNA-binding winged helix-turn-helix (wHTH) protein
MTDTRPIHRISIVVDSCLRVQIAHVRKVLNDGHDGVRHIMNVAGRGYCFVSTVSRLSRQSLSADGRPVAND